MCRREGDSMSLHHHWDDGMWMGTRRDARIQGGTPTLSLTRHQRSSCRSRGLQFHRKLRPRRGEPPSPLSHKTPASPTATVKIELPALPALITCFSASSHLQQAFDTMQHQFISGSTRSGSPAARPPMVQPDPSWRGPTRRGGCSCCAGGDHARRPLRYIASSRLAPRTEPL